MPKFILPPEFNKIRELAGRAISPIQPTSNDSKAEKNILFTATRTDGGRIRRQYRNFIAHGAFGKEGEAFLFHSSAGAVPVALEYTAKKPKFSLSETLAFDNNYALQAIEDFIAFIWSGTRAAAKIYIQDSDLPLILTRAHDGTYKKAMASVNEMNDFVDHLSHEFDNAANMDW